MCLRHLFLFNPLIGIIKAFNESVSDRVCCSLERIEDLEVESGACASILNMVHYLSFDLTDLLSKVFPHELKQFLILCLVGLTDDLESHSEAHIGRFTHKSWLKEKITWLAWPATHINCPIMYSRPDWYWYWRLSWYTALTRRFRLGYFCSCSCSCSVGWGSVIGGEIPGMSICSVAAALLKEDGGSLGEVASFSSLY